MTRVSIRRFLTDVLCISAVLASGLARAAVVAGHSSLTATTRIGSGAPTIVIGDDQAGTLAPLSLTHSDGDGSLQIILSGVADWMDADSGALELHYARNDSDPVAYGDLFSGELKFRYVFSVDEDTDVMISYESVGATTYASISGSANWWAMQGTRLLVDGATVGSANFGSTFASPALASSPQTLAGDVTVPITVGDHVLEFSIHGGALGNFPGNRSMDTTIQFQIGQNLTVPLPPAGVLMIPPLWMLRRRVVAGR